MIYFTTKLSIISTLPTFFPIRTSLSSQGHSQYYKGSETFNLHNET